MIIGVDFDGTCVKHEFPSVGEEIGASSVLKELTDKGHQIILFTMRSHRREGIAKKGTIGYDNPEGIILETDVLDDAIGWFEKHDIPLYGVNENPIQKSWTDSPKPYCNLFIDDAALGCPLIADSTGRDYVDWDSIRAYLIANKVL